MIKYKDRYISREGKVYPVNVYKQYGDYVDLEIDPEIDNITMLKVGRKMVVINENGD